MNTRDPADVARFTPTERRIMLLLNDGLPHKSREVWECLEDEQAARVTMRVHISNIRAKLLRDNEGIICEMRYGALYYRYVSLKCIISKDGDQVE